MQIKELWCMKYKKIQQNKAFIGREFEKKLIFDVLDRVSKEPQILVVYGRRRSGKTELIEQTLRNRNIIKIEGVEKQPQSVQISLALKQFSEYCGERYIAKLQLDRWWDFFDLLKDKLPESTILYFEEVQWLANYETEFIADLKYFWDNHFRSLKGLLLVLCGSSPSFIINKVIKSKALYNRSQHVVHLKQFSIQETAQFLGDRYSKQQVLDTYLSVGGIPEYLKRVQENLSVLFQLCKHSFTSDSFFALEFEKVFTSSLASNVHYKDIIEFLSVNKYADRNQILNYLQRKSGGDITEVLKDLEECELIKKYSPYNSGKTTTLQRYHIADAYLNFYYRFIRPIEEEVAEGEFNDAPLTALNMSAYHQFLAYSLERFCRKQHKHIATCLGFQGIRYKSGTYYKSRNNQEKKGFQWDLVFDRDDKVLTLCEIKYSQKPASVQVIEDFENRLELTSVLNEYKSIQRVLISPLGISNELQERRYFDHVISLDDLVS